MKIQSQQLTKSLSKSLATHYCIYGEEPLLIEEACNQIKDMGKKEGYSELIRINIESDKDWQQLLYQQQTQSLFCTTSIIECRLAKSSVGKVGSSALKSYFSQSTNNKLLIFLPGKVDYQSQKSAWFKAFDKAGILVPVPTLKGESMKKWIAQRIYQHQLKITPDALNFLYDQTAGNALVAAQEIDKLPFISASPEITLETLSQALSDSSQFTIFELVDASLRQDAALTLKIFLRLQSEQVEPILILWALTKQCRELAQMSHWLSLGYTKQQVFNKTQVWQKRLPLIEGALNAFPSEHWSKCLEFALAADKVVKGITLGNGWESLQQLLYVMTGLNMHPQGASNL